MLPPIISCLVSRKVSCEMCSCTKLMKPKFSLSFYIEEINIFQSHTFQIKIQMLCYCTALFLLNRKWLNINITHQNVWKIAYSTENKLKLFTHGTNQHFIHDSCDHSCDIKWEFALLWMQKQLPLWVTGHNLKKTDRYYECSAHGIWNLEYSHGQYTMMVFLEPISVFVRLL